MPQPPVLPRPDLALLGITYRRIPLLALGNVVYADTPLILAELEQRFPDGALGGGEEAKTWAKWSDKVFRSAVGCIPANAVTGSEAFRKDREDFQGRALPAGAAAANRPRALAGLAKGFEKVEDTLKDGRDWIMSGKVTLADVNAVWVLEWMINLQGALEGSDITKEKYPLTFAWVERFLGCMGKIARGDLITGEQAKAMILAEAEEEKAGDTAKVTPVDTGRNHPQFGRLVACEGGRVILEVTPSEESRTVKVVFPEDGFEVATADAAKL